MTHWGIDLGGTKIECAVLDENRNVLIRKRVPTEAFNGYNHILNQVKLLVN
ncbi:MAG: ROK family protein, partial [Candidatus Dadabacteria bacterium]